MTDDWKISYEDKKANIGLKGYSAIKGTEFDTYLQTKLNGKVNYYLGNTSFRNFINNLNQTGFDTAFLEKALEPSKDIKFWEWGEFLAYDQMECHLEIDIPWPPSWDRRVRRASLPGSDIVGLKKGGGSVIFVFGEIKTSKQERYPPDVMTHRDKGMIDQIKNLLSRENNSDLVKWLSLKSIGQRWEGNFEKALKYYIQNDIGFNIVGILVRDTNPNISDLNCVFEKLGIQEIPTAFYAYYLPHAIDECIAICLNGGGNNAVS